MMSSTTKQGSDDDVYRGDGPGAPAQWMDLSMVHSTRSSQTGSILSRDKIIPIFDDHFTVIMMLLKFVLNFNEVLQASVHRMLPLCVSIKNQY